MVQFFGSWTILFYSRRDSVDDETSDNLDTIGGGTGGGLLPHPFWPTG
jgi:hypothetical protein